MNIPMDFIYNPLDLIAEKMNHGDFSQLLLFFL